jgi:glycerol-3-phosphate dehydrogenase
VKRDIERLCDDTYDLLIIGGGIYGAAIARAAALQNLKVALIERGDFGQATSANSLKVVHGGLRYLQHLDVKRMRESIRARRRLLQLAPHLVHPQSFVIPTYRHGLHGKELMAVALALNDLVSWDRNRSVHPAKRIPSSRTLSRQECLHIMPGVNQMGLTGAAQWYDCVVCNTERLTLSFILSAAERGARVTNYVQAKDYIVKQDTVSGINATDCLTGNALAIRSRLTVDATGPWTDTLTGTLPKRYHATTSTAWVKAINLVVTRRLFQDHAVGIPGSEQYADPDAAINKGDRYHFFVPWHQGTLIGTSYWPYQGSPEACVLEAQDLDDLIEEVNQIYPCARLTRDDVSFFHAGLLPAASSVTTAGPRVQLIKHEQITDYAEKTRLNGLVGVGGVKYTTAVEVADKVTRLVLKKLGRRAIIQSPEPPLVGGEEVMTDVWDVPSAGRASDLKARTFGHLKRLYGTRYEMILAYARRHPTWIERISPEHDTIIAEVVHAVREEMARKLSDIVLRRTELGTLGYPGDSAINRCAEIMARELRWNRQRIKDETDEVRQLYDLPAASSAETSCERV